MGTLVAVPVPVVTRSYLRWSAGAQLARLPVTMAPLAFGAAAGVATGSPALGGAMVAALVTAEVVLAVPFGRLVDRVGARVELRILLAGRSAAYAGLLVAVALQAPGGVLVALAGVTGALGASVLGGFRSLLTPVVGAGSLDRAVALNAMVVDVVIVAGPVLVGVLLAVGAPAPLEVMALSSVAACALVPPAGRGARGGQERRAARTVPDAGRIWGPVAGWAAAAFALGHLTSTVEVAALPLAQRWGTETPGASLLVAVFCAASIAGSAFYAARDLRAGAPAAAGLLVVMALAGAAVAVAPGWVAALVAASAAGVCIGPLLTVISVRAEQGVPQGRRTEVFAVLGTTQGLGFAVGSLSLTLAPLPVVGLAGAASCLLAAPLVAHHRHRPPAPQDQITRQPITGSSSQQTTARRR